VLPEVSDIPASRLTKKLVGAYGVSLMLTEKKRYERAIIAAKGDRTKAAEALGVSRATFFRRAKELGLVKTRILSSDGPDYFN
jgi:transcriptional regulator of acetoin/glycerol metabolism